MPSVQELIETYKKYSNKELMDIYVQIDDFSEEAKKALHIVINNLGGINILKNRLDKQIDIENEISKTKIEIVELVNKGYDRNYIKANLKISLITIPQLNNLIEETINQLEAINADIKIKPRTVIGSIIGGLISGTIGGIFWGIQVLYSGHIFYIFVIGLIGLSYGTIRLFTKQSKKNVIVLLMTMLSVVYALILGTLIIEIFGTEAKI